MQLDDLKNDADIKRLVDTFYDKIRNDALLGPVFNANIGEHWVDHLDKMYRFWGTVFLEVHTYQGSPFPPHSRLDIGQEHFDRWLNLFAETLDQMFYGPKALKAKQQSETMAILFLSKINHLRSKDSVS